MLSRVQFRVLIPPAGLPVRFVVDDSTMLNIIVHMELDERVIPDVRHRSSPRVLQVVRVLLFILILVSLLHPSSSHPVLVHLLFFRSQHGTHTDGYM